MNPGGRRFQLSRCSGRSALGTYSWRLPFTVISNAPATKYIPFSKVYFSIFRASRSTLNENDARIETNTNPSARTDFPRRERKEKATEVNVTTRSFP